jgi:hypothetical protein
MRAPGLHPLRSVLRSVLRGLSYAVFQLMLVLLYALHLTRAVGSPFRAGGTRGTAAWASNQLPTSFFLLPG